MDVKVIADIDTLGRVICRSCVGYQSAIICLQLNDSLPTVCPRCLRTLMIVWSDHPLLLCGLGCPTNHDVWGHNNE